jgi:AcrR family transcriptional regulator
LTPATSETREPTPVGEPDPRALGIDPDSTSDRILQAATRALAEDPATSMLLVARAASIGRATLYRHFPSREALIRAIRLKALRECRAALADADLDEGPAAQAIERAIEALLAVVDRYRVLVHEPPPDRSDPVQRALVEEVEAPLLALIERGVDGGEVAPDLPPRFVLDGLVGLLTAARRAIVDGQLAPERAGAAVSLALLHGIGRAPAAAAAPPRPA